MAVLIPGHNEALLIAQVVKDFKIALPSAKIYVYDNCPSDDTTAVAIAAGAMVRAEPWPGKGNVVRRMFADIDADVFVVADGSGTYDPTSAPLMVIKIISDELDMVLGTRRDVYENAHHTGHGFVNKLFNGIYRSLFGPLFYGYFSRLSGVFAPARKELPWSIQRLRNPNGDVGPRKSAAHADCRDSDCIWRAPRGGGKQATIVSRRL